MPASSSDVQQRRSALARLAHARGPARPLCGTTTMKRRGPSSASAFRRSTSSGAATVRFATTSVTSNGRPSACEVDHHVLDRQPGRLLAGARSGRAAASPRTSPGSVETMISSIGCARDRVHGGVERVAVADLARRRRCPEVAHELQREVDAHLRRVAHDLVVDDVAVARPRLRHDDEEARVPPRRALADAIEQRLAADRLVREDQDVSALARPPRSTLGRRWRPPAASAAPPRPA